MGRLSEAMLDGDSAPTYPNAPGHRGIDTSVAAAKSMLPHVTMLQQRIIDHLRPRGAHGSTYMEIIDGCKLGAPTVTGRMVELVHAGLVKVAKNTRPTPSGRQARVYILVEFAS